MQSLVSPIIRLNSALSQQRRQLGQRSPRDFAKVYLSNNCDAPFSRMHLEIFALLEQTTEQRKGRLAIAAPRGHAKSTIVTLVYVLWCLLYEKERLILIASNTQEQAIQLLKDIKHQLKTNPLLIADFPEICTGPKPKPWRDNKIQLPNGAMVCVYGAGQSPRGLKNDCDRPGLIIADDLENEEQSQIEEQRDKLRSWFNGTLLKTGHPDTNVVVIGTLLHQNSLLAQLINPIQSPGWVGQKYQAVGQFSDQPQIWQQWVGILRGQQDYQNATGSAAAQSFYEDHEDALLAGTQVLWPERESYLDLMLLKETEGLRSFQSEKQNDPIDPQQCIIKTENLTFWDDTYPTEQQLLEMIGNRAEFYGACDPALGNRRSGDWTAIVVLVKDRKNQIFYVIAADLSHNLPNEAIEKILAYARIYRFRRFVVESNNFQNLMVQDLKRRAQEESLSLKIDEVNNRSHKVSRISSLEPYLTQGRLQLSRRHQRLLDQLLQFPMGRHDDGPDALEMAVSKAIKPRNSWDFIQV